jgi:hypothetical protein
MGANRIARPERGTHRPNGWDEFNEQIDAVVMGSVALDAGPNAASAHRALESRATVGMTVLIP